MSMENKQERPPKAKVTLLSLILIQAAVIVYTGSSVCSKMASSHAGEIMLLGQKISWLSWTGYFWLCLEVVCLGMYAVFWQQIIKRFDLSIAYANRATAIFWTFLWGMILFQEKIKPLNIVGVLIVFLGVLLVNQDESH